MTLSLPPMPADVVGLYLATPEKAIVISVDEKAFDPGFGAQAGLPQNAEWPALTSRSHDYRRHGTTTLFAAFNVATGAVIGRQYKRGRRIEFLDFMKRVVAAHPGRNSRHPRQSQHTHKPKNDQWLKRHENVHFHFTPTKTSWLNQGEISILSYKALAVTSFTSIDMLRTHIDFIAARNIDAKPFCSCRCSSCARGPDW
jgi:DDE superfamily endonuclease